MTGGSRSYAPIADRYEQARGGETRARQLVDALLPWLEPGWAACDVGAGTGIVSSRLAASGLHMCGFDISVEMLRQALPRMPGRVALADAAALPLRSSTVDACLFVWVLHHVGDLDAALAEAARVVRPGGRVLAVSGVAEDVDDDLGVIYGELEDALRPTRREHAGRVMAAAAAAGLSLHATSTATIESLVSPIEAAAGLEARLYAPLWDLDEHTWARVVAPRIAATRALPEPDRPRRRRIRHPVWVWELQA